VNEIFTNYLPNSVEDLYSLNGIIEKEVGFVEVQTRSPRYSQLKSVVPVFVIPGFRPKHLETLYKQFFYPVFEARLPEQINSIDELSRLLIDVNKIFKSNFLNFNVDIYVEMILSRTLNSLKFFLLSEYHAIAEHRIGVRNTNDFCVFLL